MQWWLKLGQVQIEGQHRPCRTLTVLSMQRMLCWSTAAFRKTLHRGGLLVKFFYKGFAVIYRSFLLTINRGVQAFYNFTLILLAIPTAMHRSAWTLGRLTQRALWSRMFCGILIPWLTCNLMFWLIIAEFGTGLWNGWKKIGLSGRLEHCNLVMRFLDLGIQYLRCVSVGVFCSELVTMSLEICGIIFIPTRVPSDHCPASGLWIKLVDNFSRCCTVFLQFFFGDVDRCISLWVHDSGIQILYISLISTNLVVGPTPWLRTATTATIVIVEWEKPKNSTVSVRGVPNITTLCLELVSQTLEIKRKWK